MRWTRTSDKRLYRFKSINQPPNRGHILSEQILAISKKTYTISAILRVGALSIRLTPQVLHFARRAKCSVQSSKFRVQIMSRETRTITAHCTLHTAHSKKCVAFFEWQTLMNIFLWKIYPKIYLIHYLAKILSRCLTRTMVPKKLYKAMQPRVL